MEAAVLDLQGDEAAAKTLERPVTVERRKVVEVLEIEESENQPLPQEVIQRPKKSLWRQFRVRILPVLVFLAAVAGIIYFWPRY